MVERKRIGIIGAGKMGAALIAGLLRAETVEKDDLCASDVSAQRRDQIAKTYGIQCFTDNKMAVSRCDIVVLAVEPVHVKAVLEEVGEELAGKLLVSIAAGTSIAFLKKNLQRTTIPIVRAMPNNPCMVGEGMTVLAPSPEASGEDLEAAEAIFSAVGKVMVLDERFFDAVTGLSGSGPAYIYLVVEGLVEGGVRAGLPEDKALVLAAQTVLGAGKMVLETGLHPAKLREMVTTPGGTTIEGLKELERGNVKAALSMAVGSAARKSKELVKA